MADTSSNLQLTFYGTLKGHNGWVTSIAVPSDPTKNFIVTGSRGTLVAPPPFLCNMDGWMAIG